MTNDLDIWLVNDSDTMIEVKAGELMGFNVGGFKEIALGNVADASRFLFGDNRGFVTRFKCELRHGKFSEKCQVFLFHQVD